MEILFATCNRNSALGYLKAVYPRKEISDTPECAGPLLDLVEKDILRVQDPTMYGGRIGIIAGNAYQDEHSARASEVAQEFARRASALSEAA